MVSFTIDRIRIKRTLTPNLAPSGLEEGELAVEMASDPMRLWVGVPAALDPSGRKEIASTSGFLPLSGGALSGALSVTGNLSASVDVVAGASLYAGGIRLYNDGASWLVSSHSFSAPNLRANDSVYVNGLQIWNNANWVNAANLRASSAFHCDGSGQVNGNFACSNQISSNTMVANGITSNGDINAAGNSSTSGQVWGNTVVANGITSNGNIGAAAQVSGNTVVANGITSNGGITASSGNIVGLFLGAYGNAEVGNELLVNVNINLIYGSIVVFAGTGYKPGGGEWAVWSDRRTKQSEVPYQRGLDVITQLQPVEYRYNGKARTPTDRSYIGVTADDVIGVMPEIVHRCHPNIHPEEYLAVESGAVTWALVNSVKELHTTVQQLRAELDRLRSVRGAAPAPAPARH